MAAIGFIPGVQVTLYMVATCIHQRLFVCVYGFWHAMMNTWEGLKLQLQLLGHEECSHRTRIFGGTSQKSGYHPLLHLIRDERLGMRLVEVLVAISRFHISLTHQWESILGLVAIAV